MMNPPFLRSGDTRATLNSSGTVEDSNDLVTIILCDTTGSSALMESFRSHDGAGSKSQCFDAAFTITLLTASSEGTESGGIRKGTADNVLNTIPPVSP